MKKVLLIAQTPGRSVKSKDPLDGAAGRRLAALAGLDLPDFLARFDRVNLMPEWPEARSDDQTRVILASAREAADRLRAKLRRRKAVLLGRGVAAAFRLVPDDYAWFQPVEVPPGVEVAVMPHPSGISHWWNDPANLDRARDFMLALRVGMFRFRRLVPKVQDDHPGHREHFSPEQVAVALEAGRGIYAWAADVLAEQTGIRVTGETVSNYVRRYPDLALVVDRQKTRILDKAEHNVVRAIERGDVESSWKLLRSRAAAGRGYELQVNAKVEGSIQHDHRHAHIHLAPQIDGLLSDQELDVLEAVYRKLEEAAPDGGGTAAVDRPRLPSPPPG